MLGRGRALRRKATVGGGYPHFPHHEVLATRICDSALHVDKSRLRHSFGANIYGSSLAPWRVHIARKKDWRTRKVTKARKGTLGFDTCLRTVEVYRYLSEDLRLQNSMSFQQLFFFGGGRGRGKVPNNDETHVLDIQLKMSAITTVAGFHS